MRAFAEKQNNQKAGDSRLSDCFHWSSQNKKCPALHAARKRLPWSQTLGVFPFDRALEFLKQIRGILLPVEIITAQSLTYLLYNRKTFQRG